jgi:hypothetical protein
MVKFEKMGEGRWSPVEMAITARFFVLVWAVVFAAYGLMGVLE